MHNDNDDDDDNNNNDNNINTGTIKKGMVENTKRVSERANVTETQKISMLGSARILRKVLKCMIRMNDLCVHI